MVDYGKCFDLPLNLLKINEGEAGVGCGKSLIDDHKWLPDFQDEKILEVGFGQGEFVERLCQNNLVAGLDVGKASLESAESRGIQNTEWKELVRLRESGDNSKRADLKWLDAAWKPFPWYSDTFTVASCTESMEHMDNPLHCLLEIKRCVQHKGLVVISVPEHENKFGFHGGVHAYIYPGLCRQQDWRWFLTMNYFRIEDYWDLGGTACYKLTNLKEGPVFVDAFNVVKGNFYAHEIYGWVNNQNYLSNWNELEKREILHKLENPDHSLEVNA